MAHRMSPEEFVEKWRRVLLNEQATAQEYIIDLCHLVIHPTPAQSDPCGQSFCFQKLFIRADGKRSYIDVWKRDHFAWECKTRGKHNTHESAIKQLFAQREVLGNIPLLITSDIAGIEVYLNTCDGPHKVCVLLLDDLLTRVGLITLRTIFYAPRMFELFSSADGVTCPEPPQHADAALVAFRKVVSLWNNSDVDSAHPGRFVGWSVKLFNREPVAYRRNGEDAWRIPTGSKSFRASIGKSALQHHGKIWQRRGWIELRRGATSSVQGLANGVRMRCIWVREEVLRDWERGAWFDRTE